MTTDKSSIDVQLQGLYSVYLWCLKLNYMKEAKWCDEALKHMKELREENAKFRQEKQMTDNYSISKPTKTKEEYRKQYSSDDILVGEPEETLVIHGTDNEEYEELIRQLERQHCARIIRSFLITPWFLNENGKGYKDEERARIENEKLERIALAVEKG